jgi:hypothetical protein
MELQGINQSNWLDNINIEEIENYINKIVPQDPLILWNDFKTFYAYEKMISNNKNISLEKAGYFLLNNLQDKITKLLNEYKYIRNTFFLLLPQNIQEIIIDLDEITPTFLQELNFNNTKKTEFIIFKNIHNNFYKTYLHY